MWNLLRVKGSHLCFITSFNPTILFNMWGRTAVLFKFPTSCYAVLNLYSFAYILIAGLLERNSFSPLSALVLLQNNSWMGLWYNQYDTENPNCWTNTHSASKAVKQWFLTNSPGILSQSWRDVTEICRWWIEAYHFYKDLN